MSASQANNRTSTRSLGRLLGLLSFRRMEKANSRAVGPWRKPIRASPALRFAPTSADIHFAVCDSLDGRGLKARTPILPTVDSLRELATVPQIWRLRTDSTALRNPAVTSGHELVLAHRRDL